MNAAAKTAILSCGAALIALALVGCQSTGSDPNSVATDTPENSQSSSTAPGMYDSAASALDNLPAFEAAINKGAEAKPSDTGKNLVNALVNAGFPKESIQVTFNKTKTGQDADSVIVSVLIENSCLIGQKALGGDTFTSLESALATGGCLIGITRQIDW